MLPFLLPLFPSNDFSPLSFGKCHLKTLHNSPLSLILETRKPTKAKRKKIRRGLEEIKIEGEEKLRMTLRDTSSLQSISLLASVSYNYNGSHRAEIAGDASGAFYLYQRQLLGNFTRR